MTSTFEAFVALGESLDRAIIGQPHLSERLLTGLLANGHILIEGAPGLAKTRAVKTLASLIDASFKRVQFTPDLLPSDITGTEIYRPGEADFEFQPGPIFNQLVLADEINRAPAKVQSALLEAMGERQVTVGNTSYLLPELFMVVATQNPIEHEGTYDLPQAQLDRFLLQVKVDYPGAANENRILELARNEESLTTLNSTQDPAPIIHNDLIFNAQDEIRSIHVSPPVQEYMVQLVVATRNAEAYGTDTAQAIAKEIQHGASPRATIALDRCARSRAWLKHRDYVTPDDVQSLIHDCLRHRIVLSLSAQSRSRTSDQVIDDLLTLVPVV